MTSKRKFFARIAVITIATLVLVVAGGWVVYLNAIQKVEHASDNGNGAERSELAQTKTNKEEEIIEDTNKQIEFRCSVVYSPGYLINLGGLEKLHPFDIRKYEKIHNQLLKEGVLTDKQTLSPSSLTREDLLLVHSEKYLQSLTKRDNIARYLEADALRYAPVSLDKAVLRPFRRASGGTLLAARKALETGIAINLGGGYHHAKPSTGEGFCVYADVPIAIRKLQAEKLIQRAVVIDVDVHQGNGTAVCLANDDDTFTFSMHQGDIYPHPKEESDLDVELESGMGDEEYIEILKQSLVTVLAEANADICFIVGGCDTLSGDPLASLEMTPEGIVQRDALIVEACRQKKLPVVLTLSGGYSPEAWKSQHMSVRNLIEKYPLTKGPAETDQPTTGK